MSRYRDVQPTSIVTRYLSSTFFWRDCVISRSVAQPVLSAMTGIFERFAGVREADAILRPAYGHSS